MSISKKGSRPITVDGVIYRWRIRLEGEPRQQCSNHVERITSSMVDCPTHRFPGCGDADEFVGAVR